MISNSIETPNDLDQNHLIPPDSFNSINDVSIFDIIKRHCFLFELFN
jgi:hypothetical protein